jgi:hypothetical protein
VTRSMFSSTRAWKPSLAKSSAALTRTNAVREAADAVEKGTAVGRGLLWAADRRGY